MSDASPEAIRATILETLSSIAPEIDANAIVPDEPLREQVDLDSMDFLNVIIRLHEVLKIDIPESDYGSLATLDGAVDYLARRVASRP
ncbi:MAG: acyl carrier protein [Burkholderiales bacterium]|nr:acyl carrier protein [Burkholderiales bacterium]